MSWIDYPTQGCREHEVYQGTLWTGFYPITGYNHSHNLEKPTAHVLIPGVGNRSSWSKPSKHEENLQTPQTLDRGKNRTSNPNPGEMWSHSTNCMPFFL